MTALPATKRNASSPNVAAARYRNRSMGQRKRLPDAYNVDGATEEEPVRIPLYTHLQSIAFVPQVIDTKLGMGVIDFYTITRQVNSSLPTTHRSPTV